MPYRPRLEASLLFRLIIIKIHRIGTGIIARELRSTVTKGLHSRQRRSPRESDAATQEFVNDAINDQRPCGAGASGFPYTRRHEIGHFVRGEVPITLRPCLEPTLELLLGKPSKADGPGPAEPQRGMKRKVLQLDTSLRWSRLFRPSDGAPAFASCAPRISLAPPVTGDRFPRLPSVCPGT